MATMISRIEYKEAPWMCYELCQFIANAVGGESIHGNTLVYIDPDSVEEIRDALKEAKERKFLKEFNEWLSECGEDRVEDGFDIVISW